jgi:hypothetical protein
MFHRNSFHLQSNQKVAIQQLDRKLIGGRLGTLGTFA